MDYTELLPPPRQLMYLADELDGMDAGRDECFGRAAAILRMIAEAPALLGAERERCAAACERFAERIAPPCTSHPQCDAMAEGAYACAAAIRALPDQPPSDDAIRKDAP